MRQMVDASTTSNTRTMQELTAFTEEMSAQIDELSASVGEVDNQVQSLAAAAERAEAALGKTTEQPPARKAA